MILKDVADGADLFIETAALFHAELLRHRDLHAGDMVAVPQRLHERVREAEEQQVLHRLLAEEVIDPVDGRLGEALVQRAVQRFRGRQVAAEWLLDDQASLSGRADFRERGRDDAEEAGRNGEIEERTDGGSEREAQTRERVGRRVVAGDIRQPF